MNKKILYTLTILLILGIAVYILNQNKVNITESIISDIPSEQATTTIKVALLREPAADSDMKILKGCDVVVMKELIIPATTTPLNAAMLELFKPNKEYLVQMEFAGRDFISSQKDLLFDRVSVKEGRAQVYLKGKVGPLAGVCDNPRIKTQIEETVFQFPLITKVEIYLNGVPTDFNFSEKGDISEMMNLNLYIQDKELAKTKDCSATNKISYQVPKTTAVADTSLKILFADELSMYGVYKSVAISNGVAKIMLASDMTSKGYPIGSLSSCESSHLVSVLTKTLTQYSTVKSIELYSPKGKIEF